MYNVLTTDKDKPVVIVRLAQLDHVVHLKKWRASDFPYLLFHGDY